MRFNSLKGLFYLGFIICIVVFFQRTAFAEADVDISIKKAKGIWLLTYSTQVPAKRIAFVSNPDDSRTVRWAPVSDAFELVYNQEQEYVQRKDGGVFKRVSLQLTPTYTALPKAYAPFAPYSDGGVLIHTGRLFACANQCVDDANGWSIDIQVEGNEQIIANGHLTNQESSWIGYDSGQYVYVGQQKPIETHSFLALIDNGLPDKIKTALNEALPKAMMFFEAHLGVASSAVKPMLFASYSNKPGKDIQGGTLPNQVFIHWDVDNLEERLNKSDFVHDTLWTFAHEAAHFYQWSSLLINDKSESWLHEGNAERLAALALLDLYPTKVMKRFVDDSLNDAKSRCIVALKKHALINASEHGDYRAYYQCGFVIHSLIDKKARELSDGQYSIFTVWKDFRKQAVDSGKSGSITFWQAAERYISPDLLIGLQQLVSHRLDNPEEYIERLVKL
jgi:hypothetical protein